MPPRACLRRRLFLLDLTGACAVLVLFRASLSLLTPTALCTHPTLCAELVMLVLRDGRHIVGTLVSYDHFGA